MENDREADFVRLISAHDGEVRRYLYTLLPNLSDVDEVMQETAQSLWQKFDQYDPDRPFKPWACRFAYFEALQFRRRASRDRLIFREELLELIAEQREQEQPFLEQRRAALEHCLERIAQADRDLLQQRYAAEEKIVALAERWGQPVKKLYNKLDRIRARLALCIDERVNLGGA